MARGIKQIEGQLSFDFSLDTGNYVVQANDPNLPKKIYIGQIKIS